MSHTDHGAPPGRDDGVRAALSQDCEGADLVMADNNYNWFSTALSLQTRNADYANPYMRYKMPYNQIGVCQEIIKAYPAETTDHEGFRLYGAGPLLPVQLHHKQG